MTAGSVVAPFIIPIRVPPPGKSKHEIDTATPIEIKSDTPDVTVFYTLDGSKPEVRRRPGFGDGGTLKYAEPIRLPSGKVPVRAVAVTSDGRESAVVTKVFIVEYVPSEVQTHSVNNLEDQDYSLNNSMHVSLQPLLEIAISLQKNLIPKFLSFQSAGTVHSLFKKLTRTQMSRIQRETDFLRCPECLSHRPSDPFARFCLHCGAPLPPIPGRRLPPTEGGQMAQCVQCKSMVPVNTSSCVVCEAPLEPQLQPQASLRLRDKVICPSCGTGNPAHISYCVTCETKLSQTDRPLRSGQCAPPVPSSEGKMVSCSKCWRVNHSDARFCDWCGAKPGHVASSVTCSQCGASSHPYANYCGNCGVFLEGPPRRNAQLGPQEGTLEPEQVTMHVDAQTQTVGLFYPSGTELQRKIQKRELELSKQEKMSDRKPLLTAISPGRGFWRKQLDHICAHLRSYAQNNSEFRALVGEPRMGRVRTEHRPLWNTMPYIATDAFLQESKDSLLLKEVGPEGLGRIAVVQQLLDEGANPSCLGSDTRPVLVAAVLNGHHDVIPVLVQKGADVDQASGPLNNTALHEAAALGREALQCNTSLRKLNDEGQTPYDIAESTGCSALLSLMMSHRGQGLAQPLPNSRSPSGLDTFS
uniref:Double zinc ribbon and ankyrin repeat-containing protein 1 n=1 Tax=Electrophorus electricus TaxID=8005 RepID=A0A4W4HSG1_ELEEL